METMRRIAFEMVLRACGFGSLAIFCIMIGLSFHPRLAFQAGGFLTLLMVAILILKAIEAETRDYRRTEMWLYLSEEQRPPKAYAQWASSTVLRAPISALRAGPLWYRSACGCWRCCFPSSAVERQSTSVGPRDITDNLMTLERSGRCDFLIISLSRYRSWATFLRC
jgi:hypothetical protein